jgi:hypothetical protein
MRTKFVRVLQKLDDEQRYNLSVFMQMKGNGLTNKDRKIAQRFISLYNHLEDEEQIWEKVLEGSECPDHRRMVSRLFKASEPFLAHIALKKDVVLSSYLTSAEYEDRGLHQLFEKKIESSRKANEENLGWYFNYYFYNFILSIQYARYKSNFSAEGMMFSRGIVHLEHALQFYAAKYYSSDIFMNNSREKLNTDERTEYARRVVEIAESTEATELKIYRQIMELHGGNATEGMYEEVKELIIGGHLKINPPEIKELLYLVMLYLMKQLNTGQNFQKNIREYLLFVDYLDKEGMLLDAGYLRTATYNNSITLAILIEEYDWVDRFVLQKSRFLRTIKGLDFKVLKYLNEAHLALCKNNNDRCIEKLFLFSQSNLYRKSFFYKTNADRILLKALCQKRDFRAVKERLPAYKKFVKRMYPAESYYRKQFLMFSTILQKFVKHNELILVDSEGLPSSDKVWLRKIYELNNIHQQPASAPKA